MGYRIIKKDITNPKSFVSNVFSGYSSFVSSREKEKRKSPKLKLLSLIVGIISTCILFILSYFLFTTALDLGTMFPIMAIAPIAGALLFFSVAVCLTYSIAKALTQN